jgi:hypothetical protein
MIETMEHDCKTGVILTVLSNLPFRNMHGTCLEIGSVYHSMNRNVQCDRNVVPQTVPVQNHLLVARGIVLTNLLLKSAGGFNQANPSWRARIIKPRIRYDMTALESKVVRRLIHILHKRGGNHVLIGL